MNHNSTAGCILVISAGIVIFVLFVVLSVIIPDGREDLATPAFASPMILVSATALPALAKNLQDEPLQTYLIALATSSPNYILQIRPRTSASPSDFIVGHVTSYSLSFICLDQQVQTCIRFDDILFVTVQN